MSPGSGGDQGAPGGPAAAPTGLRRSVWQAGLRWRVAIASALLALSLGLPWAHSLTWSTDFHAGWYVAGLCRQVQTWDGWYESVCEPGVAGPSWTSQRAEANTTHGAQHGGRFGVASALVLIAMAWRLRRPRYLMLAAMAVAVFTVLSAGLGLGSAGSSAAWLAALLLASTGLSPGRSRLSTSARP